MGVVLRGPGIYIPPDILTNQDIIHDLKIDTSDEWITSRSGIKERRISVDTSTKEMAILAAKDLESRIGNIVAEEIILATNKHEGGEFPGYSAAVGTALGITNALSVDMLVGCPGFVYGVRSAYNAIKVGEKQSILVAGVERLSDFTNYADRSTCFLFGDGAGIVLLEDISGEEGIIANYVGGEPDVGEKGEFANGYLSTKYMLGKKLIKTEDGYATEEKYDDYLVMEGRRVFKFATTVMEESVHGVLERSKYALKDVDVIIPHGANMRIIEYTHNILREQGFKGEVFTNMQQLGNTSTASIPLATAQALDEGVVKPGSLVLNVSFGAGFTYGANLYRSIGQ